jgi:hypothetical protein
MLLLPPLRGSLFNTDRYVYNAIDVSPLGSLRGWSLFNTDRCVYSITMRPLFNTDRCVYSITMRPLFDTDRCVYSAILVDISSGLTTWPLFDTDRCVYNAINISELITVTWRLFNT